jgi:hypothetical protein
VALSAAAGLSVFFTFYRLCLPLKVVVPKSDIDAGSVIGQGDIGYIKISRKDKHSLALTDPQLVVGKLTKQKLYAMEPILSEKITGDRELAGGLLSSLGPDCTYITLSHNDARWPQGLRTGDTVSAIAVIEGLPGVVGEKLEVLAVSGSAQPPAGHLGQIKNTFSEQSLTLAVKWPQLGPLLHGWSRSKELWIVPEHPARDAGGDIYEPGQLNRIKQERIHENNTGKSNPKT